MSNNISHSLPKLNFTLDFGNNNSISLEKFSSKRDTGKYFPHTRDSTPIQKRKVEVQNQDNVTLCALPEEIISNVLDQSEAKENLKLLRDPSFRNHVIRFYALELGEKTRHTDKQRLRPLVHKALTGEDPVTELESLFQVVLLSSQNMYPQIGALLKDHYQDLMVVLITILLEDKSNELIRSNIELCETLKALSSAYPNPRLLVELFRQEDWFTNVPCWIATYTINIYLLHLNSFSHESSISVLSSTLNNVAESKRTVLQYINLLRLHNLRVKKIATAENNYGKEWSSLIQNILNQTQNINVSSFRNSEHIRLLNKTKLFSETIDNFNEDMLTEALSTLVVLINSSFLEKISPDSAQELTLVLSSIAFNSLIKDRHKHWASFLLECAGQYAFTGEVKDHLCQSILFPAIQSCDNEKARQATLVLSYIKPWTLHEAEKEIPFHDAESLKPALGIANDLVSSDKEQDILRGMSIVEQVMMVENLLKDKTWAKKMVLEIHRKINLLQELPAFSDAVQSTAYKTSYSMVTGLLDSEEREYQALVFEAIIHFMKFQKHICCDNSITTLFKKAAEKEYFLKMLKSHPLSIEDQNQLLQSASESLLYESDAIRESLVVCLGHIAEHVKLQGISSKIAVSLLRNLKLFTEEECLDFPMIQEKKFVLGILSKALGVSIAIAPLSLDENN